MSAGIYQWINSKTKDVYVGSTIDFLKREYYHKYDLRKNKHPSPYLQNAWNKYGEGCFYFEVLEVVEDKEQLLKREQHWMDLLHPRYNMCLVAGSPLGVKHSAEARRNMSLAQKGQSLKERGHSNNCICCFCKRPIDKEAHPRFIQRENRICLCGCGQLFEVKENSKRRFITGHNLKFHAWWSK